MAARLGHRDEIVQIGPGIADAGTEVGVHPRHADIHVEQHVRHRAVGLERAAEGRDPWSLSVVDIGVPIIALDLEADAVAQAVADARHGPR